MNTWPYVPRVVESLVSCEYAVRVKVEGGHEVLFSVVNDRKNYAVLEQSATSRYQSRTAENEPGQI